VITALTIDLGSSTGPAATLSVAWNRCTDGRHQYRYWVLLPDGDYLCRGRDLRSGVSGPVDHVQMMGTLLAFLEADAEKYRVYEMGNQQTPDGYLFDTRVAEWAYGLSDELAMAREELEAPGR